MGILDFIFGKSKKAENDGVITYLDSFDVRIEELSDTGFRFTIDGAEVNINWSDIETVVAYRTNRITDSPIHIEFWGAEEAVFPFNSKIKGWEILMSKLPSCIPLQNFTMLETMPWTKNVMKSTVFAVLHDKKARTSEEVLEVWNK